MYAPQGFGYPEVLDVEVFPAGDQLHLFHLTNPNYDVVQHVVSDDGLAWRALPTALHTGDPGACDDDAIWTMSVTEHTGTYYMVYTALSRAEGGLVQRNALATSADLIHWTKHPANPIAEADPRWYEADTTPSGRVSWRDPKPLRVDDTYYAVVCARQRGGPLLRRGCVGLMASPDLVHWEVRPPLFTPHHFWDLECPQVFTIDGTYYLTAAIMEDRTQRYWMAPRFEGPYEVPPDGGILAPHGHYAGRVCRWQGRDLFYAWHETSYDWPGLRNPFGKLVVPPLVLAQRPDGSLRRESYPGWTRYRESPSRPDLMPQTLLQEVAAATSPAWSVQPGGGLDVLATSEESADFWLEGRLTLAGSAGGLAFRLDEQGGGYFLELSRATTQVSLKKWLLGRHADGLRPAFRYVELQRGHLPRSLDPGEPHPVRLLVVGPYIEFSVAGQVVLASLSAERASGRVGLWAESGMASLQDAVWAPMRAPEHK